jgi:hypothetical protein
LAAGFVGRLQDLAARRLREDAHYGGLLDGEWFSGPHAVSISHERSHESIAIQALDAFLRTSFDYVDE